MSSPVALSPPPTSPPWAELPSELTANILQRLGAEEILQSAQFVCATWWKVCQNPALWRLIKIVNRDESEENDLRLAKLTMLCRRAVDLSQGQLIDLTLGYFGDNALLHYVVDRSSHLQHLTLAYCTDISATSLVETVKKLDELEELHLISPTVLAKDIQAIGNTCPLLKSFTFNNRPWRHSASNVNVIRLTGFAMLSLDSNEQALAIAKSMPNLYHLGVLANDMNNEGLQAILDGCPRLESLDLRRCTGVDLGGPLGERCVEQIKHLRLPSDSIADYEWNAINDTEFMLNYLSQLPSWTHDSDEDDEDYYLNNWTVMMMMIIISHPFGSCYSLSLCLTCF